MKDQKTVYPLQMTEAATEMLFNGKAEMKYLSKRRVTSLINLWEARKASRHLYYYLCTSTTNRVKNYCDLRDMLIKSKTIDQAFFIRLSTSLKEVEDEMKFRSCYPRIPGSVFALHSMRT